MRFIEFAIKPIKPLTPAEARIASLKRQVDNSRNALRRERDAQRLQKDRERQRKQLSNRA